MIERQLAVPRENFAATQSLAPELQRAVQVLCDTYETLDLRIETTLGSVQKAFLSALPEIDEVHEDDLRHFIAHLINDLRLKADGTPSQPVLVRVAFQDRKDLTQQLVSQNQASGTPS